MWAAEGVPRVTGSVMGGGVMGSGLSGVRLVFPLLLRFGGLLGGLGREGVLLFRLGQHSTDCFDWFFLVY